MTRIILVRHGETEWNRRGLAQGRTDIPLNETGRQQARDAAVRLASSGASRIVTSTLSRAEETGQIIADHLGLSAPITDERLVERNYAQGEGVDVSTAAFQEALDHGIETDDEVLERALTALRDTARNASDDATIIVVSHGALMRVVLQSVSDGSFPAGRRIANTEAFEIESSNGELTFDSSDLTMA